MLYNCTSVLIKPTRTIQRSWIRTPFLVLHRPCNCRNLLLNVIWLRDTSIYPQAQKMVHGLAHKQGKFNVSSMSLAAGSKLFQITCLQDSASQQQATYPVLAKFVQNVITASEKRFSSTLKRRCEGKFILSRGTPNTYGSSSPWILLPILAWEKQCT